MSAAILKGAQTGGPAAADTHMKTVQMGNIAMAISSGYLYYPSIFVSGLGKGRVIGENGKVYTNEIAGSCVNCGQQTGADLPNAIVFVDGSQVAASSWSLARDGVTYNPHENGFEISIGYLLHVKTNRNLSGAYYVNNWPGAPYTAHQANGDSAYHYVTQVNYIT
ncbi:hypothetical protein BTA74_26100, partial [Salmonella enterica]|nr:hypothetical protein [Salmonella enterica]EBA6016933.1 hypothetical protein [Salmonella enterica]